MDDERDANFALTEEERALFSNMLVEALCGGWRPRLERIDPAAWPTLYTNSHDALMGSSLIAGWLAEAKP